MTGIVKTDQIQGAQSSTITIPGSNNLVIGGNLTVDTSTLHVDSTNNRVGVGTASPSFDLQINNSSSPTFRIEETTNSVRLDLRANSDHTLIRTTSNHDMRFNTNQVDRMTIEAGGNVGIGTTSPQAKLQVIDQIKVSSADQSSGSVVLGDGSSTNFNVGIARWNGSTNAAGAGGIGYFAQGSVNAGGHFFYTGDASAGSTTERMRIDSSGNVGIGVTPFANNIGTGLDIASGAGMFGSSNSNFLTGNLYYSSGWKYKASASGSMLLLDGNGDIKFHTAPSGTANGTATVTERMRIDASGNLLVGTTNTNPSGNNVEGSVIQPDGMLRISREGDVIEANRKTSDGNILVLKKDSSTLGRVGVANGRPYMASNDSGLKFKNADITACTSAGADKDGSVSLGANGARFQDLYLSGGAYIGGTGSANYLDDYEEGTANLAYSSVGSSFNYTYRKCYYTKVGNRVHITVYMQLDGSQTLSANTVAITGLPFTSVNDASHQASAVCRVRYFNFSSGYTYLTATVGSNTTQVGLLQNGDNVANQGTVANQLSNISGQIMFTLSYTTT